LFAEYDEARALAEMVQNDFCKWKRIDGVLSHDAFRDSCKVYEIVLKHLGHAPGLNMVMSDNGFEDITEGAA
jgi:hypothetical protein